MADYILHDVFVRIACDTAECHVTYLPQSRPVIVIVLACLDICDCMLVGRKGSACVNVIAQHLSTEGQAALFCFLTRLCLSILAAIHPFLPSKTCSSFQPNLTLMVPATTLSRT